MAAFETQAPEFGLTMLGELNAESSQKFLQQQGLTTRKKGKREALQSLHP